MFMKYESEKIKAIESITDVNYECKGDLIPMDSIIPMIEDLVCAYHKMEDDLKEKLEDEIEQRENYYKPKSEYEILGDVRERDFYE